MKLGIYPGSFDPLTNGHIDIVERSKKFIDNLIIAVTEKNNKKSLFNLDERVKMINNVIQNKKMKNITIEPFNGLLVDFAEKKDANVIIRGLRAVSDFEYEFQMTGMNFKLNPNIETIFLMASDNHQLISSNLVKEVCKLNGDVSKFVPSEIEAELKKKIK